jgi:hypothetical protein
VVPGPKLLREEYHEFDGVFDHLTKTPCLSVRLNRAQLEALRELNGWKYYNSHTARHVLRSPDALLNGCRVPQPGPGVPWGKCYVGSHENTPSIRNPTNQAVPMPPGYVFCAYVDPEGVLIEWRLEPADKDKPWLPDGYGDESRFPGGEQWRRET